MITTNVFTDARYVEGVHRLALGIEPRDALTGRATVSPVDARHELIPEPFERWRRWKPDEKLTRVLPALPRHDSGRFVLLYRYDGNDLRERTAITCRLDDGVRDHRHPPQRSNDGGRGHRRPPRRFVPRRIRVPITPQADVHKAIDPSIPIARRSVAVTLFPGSGAPIDPRATAVRCRLAGPPDGNGDRDPFRWCRLRATSAADGGVLGWGHGDERGECVVVLGRPQGGPANGSLDVQFTVGVQFPPPDPSAVAAQRRDVDPLWDLPIEDLGVGPWPADDPGPSGRRFLPEHQLIDVGAQAVPVGRTTSIEFTIT